MYRSLAAGKNNEAQEALSDVSRLLSRLATSRKASSRLVDIVNLTKEVARLGRALHNSDGGEVHNDRLDGDRGHIARISEVQDVRNVVR